MVDISDELNDEDRFRYIDNPVKAKYEAYRKEIIDKIVDGSIDYDSYNNNEYFNDKLLKEYNEEYKKIKA